jgi:N-acyl-D-aspartate/D-glutamate deacylase
MAQHNQRLLLTLITVWILSPGLVGAQAEVYNDIVIRGGRVMEPETGFDAVANVGIRDGLIHEISTDPLQGNRVIEARGMVVAPGFIDVLTSVAAAQLPGARYKVTDGVTTVLSMHGGPVDVAGLYDRMAQEGALIHYGTTVGHGSARAEVGLRSGDEAERAQVATLEQVERIVELARHGILAGAIGIGFGIQYVPSTSENEVFELFQLAARYGVSCHLHIRFLGPQRPTNSVKAIQEVIATAAATGASAHIAHVNSTSPQDIDLVMRLLDGARAHGVDITADAYPWGAGSTRLESAVFDEGFKQRMAIDYKDIEMVKTGERLTEETFRRYRTDDQRDGVIIHFIPDSTLVRAFSSPLTMVGSDGSIDADGRGHPRGAGTYARFFRRFVREEGHLTLMEAIRKTSYLAALRLQQAAPAMRRKGRLNSGADADIVVFDSDQIRERATYAEPAQTSEGIAYVLVNGVPVVDDGRLVEGVKPGRAIRGAPIER